MQTEADSKQLEAASAMLAALEELAALPGDLGPVDREVIIPNAQWAALVAAIAAAKAAGIKTEG